MNFSQKVLEIFKDITRVPRESGHEEHITAYLQRFAADRGLECKTDATGNVLIVKPAAPGKEDVPAIALQSHQDMVCEKDGDFAFDFAKDAIPYEIEDGWMIARHTTLGADDGIGIAASLALLDSDIPMGKLECLFTISEETGMDGAFALEGGFFDARTLINLDSEDEGLIFVGCAGGIDTTATYQYKQEDVRQGAATISLRISGALGGHSGDDIDKGRVNALQQLCRFLFSRLREDWQLVSLSGGNKPNAICREAGAVVAVPAGEAASWAEAFRTFGATLKAEYSTSDPSVEVAVADAAPASHAICDDVTVRLVTALFGLPHGVAAMSMDIPGLVQTSSNLAAVRMDTPGEISVITSQRSSVVSELHSIASEVEAVFLLSGADVRHHGEYPGWKPNMSSHILKVSVESYKKLFGCDPEIKAIHAGLECGLFLDKFPYLDMISIGPTLRGVHAPGERLDLASLDKFCDHLADIVTNFQ
jgi:dipeptidase D